MSNFGLACPHCHSRLAVTATFCPYCGAQLFGVARRRPASGWEIAGAVLLLLAAVPFGLFGACSVLLGGMGSPELAGIGLVAIVFTVLLTAGAARLLGSKPRD